jgi:hypothetical protein
VNPQGFALINDDLWYDNVALGSEDLERLWGKVQTVHDLAKHCFNEHKDESAWVEVVKTVWRAVSVHSEWDLATSRGMLELNSM